MPSETIGRREDDTSIPCPACSKRFRSKHGLREHERHNRCRVTYPRPERTRRDQRKHQITGYYNDPWKGRTSLSRGEDNCFACPYCGKGIGRVDKVQNHVQYHCQSVKDGLASPTIRKSCTFPANKGVPSTPSSTDQPDAIKVSCVAKAG